MRKVFDKFWAWYNKYLLLNTAIAAGLFVLQLVHLYWLTTHVVFFRLFGQSFFNPNDLIQTIIILVDYTEIPALITTSLVYINAHRKKASFKNILYLFFLNIQLLHIFWITDEFVLETFTGVTGETIFPSWLAWIAILIDYLEVPVIFETLKKLFDLLQKGQVNKLREVLTEK